MHVLHKILVDHIDEIGIDAACAKFTSSKATILRWREQLPPLAPLMRVWDENKLTVAKAGIAAPVLAPIAAPPPPVPAAPPNEAPSMTTVEVDDEPQDLTPTVEVPAVRLTTSGPAFALLQPIYDNVSGAHHLTLMKALKLYSAKHGVDSWVGIPQMRTLIDEARNDLVQRFLTTNIPWAVTVDADMALPIGNPGGVRKLGWQVTDQMGAVSGIERLMSHPASARIVGALYRDRRGVGKAQCSLGFANDASNKRLMDIITGKSPLGGLEEVGWVGFGLVRIHRSVFVEMIAEARADGKLPECAPLPPPRDKEPVGLFGRTNSARGEDVAFCRRAGVCGVKIFVDAGLVCGHEGSNIA